MYHKLSLTEGKPIGRIVGGKYDKKTIRVIPTDYKPETNEYFINDNGILDPLHTPQINDMPNRVNICGASLCGKSYITAQLARDYMKNNKNNRVALFSAVENDSNFDDVPNLYKVNCDDSILDNPISLEELKDTLCIFDDINSFPNKDITDELNYLRDIIMNTGRHENIDVISTNQVLLDGKKTKASLLNAFQIIGFCHSGGRYQMKEFLKRYMSLDNSLIDKIINLPSRWVIINRVPPVYVAHQKGVMLI